MLASTAFWRSFIGLVRHVWLRAWCTWCQQRRRAQEEKRRQENEQQHNAVVASRFAVAHTSELLASVFEGLVGDGHFFDPLTREVRACALGYRERKRGVVVWRTRLCGDCDGAPARRCLKS